VSRLNSNWRIGGIALLIISFDQVTKLLVLKYLGYAQEKVIIEGFFKFVHWGNTGAAWSMFRGNNGILALVAFIALMLLVWKRHHFDTQTFPGQISLGLIFGGIVGNLVDRIRVGHVVDFLYFYVLRRDLHEAGFPAFNVADSAICVGVGLLFILSWQNEGTQPVPSSSAKPEIRSSPAKPEIRSSPANAEMSSSTAVNSAATARNPTAYRK
jgi:signal peptidase II